MTKIETDRIAIVFDTIAYFSVTIDLYGKERVTQLSEKLSTLIEKSKGSDLYKSSSRRIGQVVALLIGVLLSIIIFEVFKLNISFKAWCIMTLAGSIVFALIDEYIIRLVLTVILKFIDGILFVLNKVKIEGLMIIFGTILFVVSKAISYHNASL